MNKKEAAAYLGVSTRAIERYVKQGKLSVKYIKGKTSKLATYDEAELARLQEELTQITHKPAIEQVTPEETSLSNSSPTLTGLLEKVIFPLSSQLTQLTEAVQSLKSLPIPLVPTEQKLLLTLKEVQALTGLSREILREAIKEGKLKAKIIGKSWRVKRGDLEDFIEGL